MSPRNARLSQERRTFQRTHKAHLNTPADPSVYRLDTHRKCCVLLVSFLPYFVDDRSENRPLQELLRMPDFFGDPLLFVHTGERWSCKCFGVKCIEEEIIVSSVTRNSMEWFRKWNWDTGLQLLSDCALFKGVMIFFGALLVSEICTWNRRDSYLFMSSISRDIKINFSLL